jgi:outer membrane receptor protein involved in Fe transport
VRFSPRIALRARFSELLYAKAQFASAFVYPAFLYRTGNTLSHYVGNPDIEPQSIRTWEALLGARLPYSHLELSLYLNQVRDFITFDLPRNGRTGKYLFSNQGNLDILGSELAGRVRSPGGLLGVQVAGSFARALGSTDPQFLVDGALGGASKFPELSGSAVVDLRPHPRLGANLGLVLASGIPQALPQEIVFSDITGIDGQQYSSRSPAAYDRATVQLNATVNAAVADEWKLSLGVQNLLDRRNYRPGSVLVPQLGDGRQTMLSLTWMM